MPGSGDKFEFRLSSPFQPYFNRLIYDRQVVSGGGCALMAEWSKTLPHTALTTTRVQILM